MNKFLRVWHLNELTNVGVTFPILFVNYILTYYYNVRRELWETRLNIYGIWNILQYILKYFYYGLLSVHLSMAWAIPWTWTLQIEYLLIDKQQFSVVIYSDGLDHKTKSYEWCIIHLQRTQYNALPTVYIRRMLAHTKQTWSTTIAST